ncbi:MAG TPA: helix-turn-helix domain-containing protein [Acidimicrobiales bacterium]|nr:helix-turn-helix domain-containing protein [Acidimicrobiales bacterium]
MGRKLGVTPAETRAKLLAAAAQVFAEHGYDGARVGEIARRAGLTTGAIYAHYGTKAELLAEAVRTHSPDELAGLYESGAIDLLSALRLAGRRLTETDDTEQSLVLEALAGGRRDAEVARLLCHGIAQRERLFALALRRARAAGQVDATVSPEAVARLCTMLAIGGLAVGSLALDDIDPGEWEAVVDRLVDAVRTPGPPTDRTTEITRETP